MSGSEKAISSTRRAIAQSASDPEHPWAQRFENMALNSPVVDNVASSARWGETENAAVLSWEVAESVETRRSATETSPLGTTSLRSENAKIRNRNYETESTGESSVEENATIALALDGSSLFQSISASQGRLRKPRDAYIAIIGGSGRERAEFLSQLLSDETLKAREHDEVYRNFVDSPLVN
jgi:hypothetical protein